MLTKEERKWEEFINAEKGYFDGYEMINIFHQKVDKRDAILVDESDDCADCRGIHVGTDGMTVYFFTEPEKVKKIVRFNHSAYCF